ncbi:DMT family transporter [Arsenicitalea aurantiaca]|uniref:DMT family transporter n=1 Tax=Arsenicitalea aurantiaca TaxID=1783274 RepID=A0A433XMB6_9HYPH|nr:DMT family transporter [Arsenicitalea aurantiaca]RUT35227.1 DMT family transporter [Arsenicitalea aurantiaca]
MLGIGLKIASVGIFLVMSSLLKAADDVPPGQLVFFRSLFAILPIIVFLVYRRELMAGLKTARPMGHLWRGLIGVCGMGCGFYALTRLPLPEAVAINYAMPLLIVVFSAIFLGEVVRLYRWSAVLIGLIGVAIIIWPRLSIFSGGITDASGATAGAIAALGGALFGAIAMLLVRNLVHTERSATIVLYFSVTCTAISLATIPFGWVWPTPQQAALLIGAGIAGGIAQVLLTECYRYADMSVIAPFEYTSMLLSIGIGYLFFGEVPTIQMLVGGVIVVAAGIFIILREHQLGLERGRARRVTTPQG